ncbi:MAG: BlaI/MecI/CopY family transcriptional regulator [Oceanicaulis sp.]
MLVLKALWAEAPRSARELQASVGEGQGWSYSTTRTLIARMVEKGLAERRDAHGLAVFAPKAGKAAVLSAMIRSFSAQVFDLDQPLPASAFADSPLLDPADIEELERLLSDESDGEAPR